MFHYVALFAPWDAFRNMRVKIGTISKVLISIILLGIILSKIDLRKMGQNFLRVDLSLYLVAMLVGYILQLMLGVWRWQLMLNRFYQIKIPYLRLLKYWWIGMFFGYFVPASIGMDIYRVVNATGQGGGYVKNATTVIGEKIFAAFGNLLMLIASYPLIRGMIIANAKIVAIIDYFYWIAIVGMIGTAVLFAFVKVGRGQRILSYIKGRLDSGVKTIIAKIGGKNLQRLDEISASTLIKPFFNWQNLAFITLLTVCMRLVASIGGSVLFQAIGLKLPLVINVFATTVMTLIFILPISFGSLGIREGSYIVLFGLFGIESEAALTVSFLALSYLLLTVCIGGIIFLTSSICQGADKRHEDEPHIQDKLFRRSVSSRD